MSVGAGPCGCSSPSLRRVMYACSCCFCSAGVSGMGQAAKEFQTELKEASKSDTEGTLPTTAEKVQPPQTTEGAKEEVKK